MIDECYNWEWKNMRILYGEGETEGSWKKELVKI